MASLIPDLSHQVMAFYCQTKRREFLARTADLKDVQMSILLKLVEKSDRSLKVKNYDDFVREFGITEYIDYQKDIESEMLADKPVRFQPTSGSTSKRKWIPYRPELLQEFDRALLPWLGDLYKNFPLIKQGLHYWSLSWLPTDMRGQINHLDDLNFFTMWQQILLGTTMAVPSDVSLCTTSEAAQLATLAYLVSSPELTFVSVWSPTFFLGLLQFLEERREELARTLETGQWEDWKNTMGGLVAPYDDEVALVLRDKTLTGSALYQRLWPKLALISAWDTSTSANWAKKLARLFPHSAFQGKGLFATEAVITIPMQHEFMLAYQSHFYEFECLDNKKIIPSWELAIGMSVSPLVTTGSQFFRYRMLDRLRVTRFHDSIPCFVFEGRLSGIDLVGEKMAPEMIYDIFAQMHLQFKETHGFCAFAVETENKSPYYLFLIEYAGQNLKSELAEWLEKKLRTLYHYNLARDLGQLSPCRVQCEKDPLLFYQRIGLNRAVTSGDLKMEMLLKIHEQHLGSNS